ncbi:MAG: PEP-CTERM sorting domain-containing protein [Verrucomicrobiales bacterium]|nr:PEP-CTERM sorting domain-containing protein [Verrucomicrobiales bacterium]
MPKLFIIASLLLLTMECGFSQGSVVYHNTSQRDKYVFMPDPSAPALARLGGSLSDYQGFQKVEGPGYYAELWWAPGEGQPEASLGPVPGSLVTFRIGPTAGLINGKARLEIPGTFGGDRVTLQLRVWENFGQTVNTWEEAMDAGCIHGKSNLLGYELAGVDPAGNDRLGSGNMSYALQYFSLVIPEPSSVSLLWLGLGAWSVSCRRRGSE